MMATFTANLIAFLAVDKYTPPFEDLEGLTEQSEYAVGILGGSTWNDLFQVSGFFGCRKFCNDGDQDK